MIKKIMLLVFLSFLAVGMGGAIMYAGQHIIKTEIDELQDIEGLYGASSGFSGTTQEQERSPNGALGITVNTRLEVSSPEVIEIALNKIGSDITSVAEDQLVNLNVDIAVSNKDAEYTLKFYPKTPGEYETPSYRNVTKLFSAIGTTTYSEYNAAVYPTTAGRNIIVTGGDETVDSDLNTRYQNFVTKTTEALGLNPGDVYDVTYENAVTATSPEFVSYSIQSFYTSDYGYDKAVNVDFDIITDYRSPASEYLNLRTMKIISGDQPGTDQLVFVVNDTSDAKIQEIAQKLPQRTASKSGIPLGFEAVVRGDIEGVNLLTMN